MTDTGKATLELRVDRGEQTPRRFSLDDRCIEVVNVFDAWLAPDPRVAAAARLIPSYTAAIASRRRA